MARIRTQLAWIALHALLEKQVLGKLVRAKHLTLLRHSLCFFSNGRLQPIIGG